MIFKLYDNKRTVSTNIQFCNEPYYIDFVELGKLSPFFTQFNKDSKSYDIFLEKIRYLQDTYKISEQIIKNFMEILSGDFTDIADSSLFGLYVLSKTFEIQNIYDNIRLYLQKCIKTVDDVIMYLILTEQHNTNANYDFFCQYLDFIGLLAILNENIRAFFKCYYIESLSFPLICYIFERIDDNKIQSDELFDFIFKKIDERQFLIKYLNIDNLSKDKQFNFLTFIFGRYCNLLKSNEEFLGAKENPDILENLSRNGNLIATRELLASSDSENVNNVIYSRRLEEQKSMAVVFSHIYNDYFCPNERQMDDEGKGKGNQTNQDNEKVDSNQENVNIDSNQVNANIDSNQGNVNVDSNQGNINCDSNQGNANIDSNQGNKKVDSNQGNVNVDSNQGNANIDSNQGNKKVDSNQGNVNVDSNQGNANVDSNQGNANVDSNQGNINCELNQGNANCELNQGNVNVDSNQGNKKVDSNQGNVNVDSNQGNKKVDSNQGNVNVDSNQGNVNVDSNQGNVNVDSNQGNINCELNQGNTNCELNQGNVNVDSNQGNANVDSSQGNINCDSNQGNANVDSNQGNINCDSNQGNANCELNQKPSAAPQYSQPFNYDSNSNNGQEQTDSCITFAGDARLETRDFATFHSASTMQPIGPIQHYEQAIPSNDQIASNKSQHDGNDNNDSNQGNMNVDSNPRQHNPLQYSESLSFSKCPPEIEGDKNPASFQKNATEPKQGSINEHTSQLNNHDQEFSNFGNGYYPPKSTISMFPSQENPSILYSSQHDYQYNSNSNNQVQTNDYEVKHRKLSKEDLERQKVWELTKFYLEAGIVNIGNKSINIYDKVQLSNNKTVTINPEHVFNLSRQFKNKKSWGKAEKHEIKKKIEVTQEGTFESALKYLNKPFKNVCVLNFADALNPGGGVERGRGAQEESLCRVSSLFLSLHSQGANEFYEFNRNRRTSKDFAFFSDHLIYSPKVVVFRDESFNFIEPKEISVISSAAVNCRLLKDSRNKSELFRKVTDTMKKRCRRILELAIEQGNEVLILGAFGCGVFGNKPEIISQIFKELLVDEFYGKPLQKIVFAIKGKPYERNENYEIFCSQFKNK
ncbi:hypothetical protein M9Y10_021454 [Tritrichomonas musculus]|uniref:Microbial-type PARG catalytic domain-containing protein n=1 Tax=Tritrichomonas musculus TaxID=1915356 RepID=A0ABR2HE25_9EUKA